MRDLVFVEDTQREIWKEFREWKEDANETQITHSLDWAAQIYVSIRSAN
jgi:hypothetical protein